MAGCVLFSFAYFFYITVFSPPIQLAELKKEGEVGIANQDSLGTNNQKASSLDKSPPAKTDTPWISNPSLVAQGDKLYQTYCWSCHGKTGAGDGPAGGALKPPPRNLIEGDWQKGGSSKALYNTLTKGLEGTSMVSFSYLSQEDRWALVHYIRSITQNKVKDDLKKLEEFGKTAP